MLTVTCPPEMSAKLLFYQPVSVVCWILGLSFLCSWLKLVRTQNRPPSTFYCLTKFDWILPLFFLQDLCSIGITALGPRKKIVHSLRELRGDVMMAGEVKTDVSKNVGDETKMGTNKLITDYFRGHFSERNRGSTASRGQNEPRRSRPDSAQGNILGKCRVRNGKQKDIPLWCCIPGTPFRVVNFHVSNHWCWYIILLLIISCYLILQCPCYDRVARSTGSMR